MSAAQTPPELGPETLRSVDLSQMGAHRWKATNRRGGVLPIGSGEDPDFTPVELLLAALAGCGAVDLDLVTGKRAPFETFAARAEGHKVRDEQGTHMVQLSVTFDVTFPAGRGRRQGPRGGAAHPATDPGPALHRRPDRRHRRARRLRRGRGGRAAPVLSPGADPTGLAADPPLRRMTTQPWREVPRQDGRRFVVTGASGGIGLETAKVLAERGAHVVLAVRNLDKGRAAADQMDGDVELGLLDVADLSSVRAFAESVGDVDVLINNAGVLALPFGLSPDGVELHLATNHLGHFALANLLLPRLTDRVVVVGSPSHRHGELDLDDLDWSRRTVQALRGVRRLQAGEHALHGRAAAPAHRGRLDAAGHRCAPGLDRDRASPPTPATGSRRSWAASATGWSGMAAWQGALPTLYAATMDVPGNTYVGPHRLPEMIGWPTGVGRSQRALDPDLAKALWAESERLSGVAFPF